jgi:hypothetical protein
MVDGAVYVTEHVPFAPRLHVVEESDPEMGLMLQVTVPVGMVPVPGDVSNALAVHVVVLLTGTGFGEQLILRRVVRWVTVRAYVPELPR